MSFGDIKGKIRKFYKYGFFVADHDTKKAIEQKTLALLRSQKREKRRELVTIWRYRFSFSLSLFVLVGALGFFQSSLREQQLLAGEVQPMIGPVEIIRGNQSLFVEDPVDVFVGDIIKTGNHGEVKISIPNEFTSIAKNRTQFRITDKKTLFLDKGVLENKIQKRLEVATDRGFIRGAPGGEVEINVSESGETQVLPHKKDVQVFDLLDGRATLNPGEEIKLRSDTQLSNKNIPDDLELSNAQIKAIRSKLTIARTKIVTGLEHSTLGEREKAAKDFASAEKTFLSLTQILKTSRELEIARRKNLKNLGVEKVFPEMKKRVKDKDILNEIKAIESLFIILQQHKGALAFAPHNTDIEDFDRYVLLQNLIQLGTSAQQFLSEPILEKYTVNFMRKIQNKELRVDQVAMLDELLEKLPNNKNAYQFLQKVKLFFPEEFAKIIEEKIQYRF